MKEWYMMSNVYTRYKYNYDYELITDLETLKNKIYEQVSGLYKNQHTLL